MGQVVQTNFAEFAGECVIFQHKTSAYISNGWVHSLESIKELE